MPDTMHAVRIHEFGEPEVLVYEEVARPEPKADQVLIQIHAAGINPVDWKTRRGRGMTNRPGATMPYIIGWDVSGVITQVGANVTGFKTGDEVYGMIGFPDAGAAYAEYTLASPDHIHLKPKNLTHVEASAIPLVALTSWQAFFDYAGLDAGQRILIHGVSGGVGHIAVQLARWKGAEVWGTASGHNQEFAESLGVDHFVDYTIQPFEEVVRDMDVVYDTPGGKNVFRSFKTLRPGGFIVVISGSPDVNLEHDTPPGLRSKQMLVHTDAEQLHRITELVEAGSIQPHISAVFPLTDIQEAHRLIESGHTRGKIAIQVVNE